MELVRRARSLETLAHRRARRVLRDRLVDGAAGEYAIRLTRTKRFVYFIQDFEPLFHAASTAQALAEETYALDYVPVLNTRILADFFTERRIGRFADPAFAGDAVVFEPALDRALFHPAPRAVRARRRVLFYARPTSGLRNLFELAVAALQQAVEEGVLPADQWEFLGMGEAFTPVDLGHGAVLRPAPWLGLQEYADSDARERRAPLADDVAPPELSAPGDGGMRWRCGDDGLRQQGCGAAGRHVAAHSRRCGDH